MSACVLTSHAVSHRAWLLAGTALLTALGIAAVGAPTSPARAEVSPVGAPSANAWRLQHAESFDTNVNHSKAAWFKDGDGPTSPALVDEPGAGRGVGRGVAENLHRHVATQDLVMGPDRYVLSELVGRGGMADVHRALPGRPPGPRRGPSGAVGRCRGRLADGQGERQEHRP